MQEMKSSIKREQREGYVNKASAKNTILTKTKGNEKYARNIYKMSVNLNGKECKVFNKCPKSQDHEVVPVYSPNRENVLCQNYKPVH